MNAKLKSHSLNGRTEYSRNTVPSVRLPLDSFRVGESVYERSIAIDASTIDGITITVAVNASRIEELDILDSIYSAAEGYPFFPFRDKSNDLPYEDSVDFLETVIQDNSQYLTATTHLGEDGSDSERVEAVQSAVLVEKLGHEDTLVILDGDGAKADRFGRAFTGISASSPPMATCIQSELYYPTALLADLCANHLASTIDHPRQCSDVTPPAPVTKEAFNNLWGSAYNAMITATTPIESGAIEQRRAETVRTRMNCWFEGVMGGGESIQFESSVRPIVQFARREGYEELATWLSEV